MCKRRQDEDSFLATLAPPMKMARYNDHGPPWNILSLANSWDMTAESRRALTSDRMLLSIFNEWDVSFNPQLTEIELAKMLGMTPDARAPHLKSLNLAHCTITDGFLIALSRFAPSLTNIRLDGCTALTDSALAFLAEACPQLTDLSVAGCHFGDTGLESVARGLPQLTFLNLTDCHRVTGKSMRLIVECCPLIHTLRISGTAIDADALMEAASLFLLTELDVASLPISAPHLALIASSQPLLQRLNISFCHDVTSEALSQFVAESSVKEIKAFGLEAACAVAIQDQRIVH